MIAFDFSIYSSNKLNAYELSNEQYTYKYAWDKTCFKQYIMNNRNHEVDFLML